MSNAAIAVYSNALSPEREEAYSTWYESVHVKDMLAVPSVLNYRRYVLGEVFGRAPSHRFLAVYEVAGDPAAAWAEVAAAAEDWSQSEDIDVKSLRIEFHAPLAEGSA